MEKHVIISIQGMQALAGEEPEVIELVTEGRLADSGGGYTLSYQESQLTGMEGTLTTFQVEPERVTLTRMGEFNSQMIFQPGQRHLSLYETPFGALSVWVRTRRMRSSLGPTGGELCIDYAIDIDHAAAGENRFRIQVREQNDPNLKQ